jgi:membrane-bound serine protease (ClpP class)
MLRRTIGKLCIAWVLAAASALAGAAPASVVVISVSGAIGPASADFIERSIARADGLHAQLAVIELDTPGGLDPSMRQIIKAIIGSPVPVAAFIAPGGARAASAGTYIVYASHIAAMAPGTNLGAATPIQLGIGGEPGAPPDGGRQTGERRGGSDRSPRGSSGDGAAHPGSTGSAGGNAGAAASGAAGASGTPPSPELPTDTRSTESRKQVHDAAAYIRGLAQMRGRNGEWAERAVREAVSLSADDALAQHVVDVIARDVPELLTKVDGRHVVTTNGEHTLATAHAPIVRIEPDWRSRVLAVITDPNVALILMMIGMYGLFFEFANPGFVLPGVVGAISLLVGLFALQLLPINFAGLILILLGLAFLIAEAFLPTFGALGFGGIVAFAMGALMLIDTDVPGFGIPFSLVFGLSLLTAAFVLTVSSVALKARRRPVVTGSEALIGSIGVMLDDLTPGAGAATGDGSEVTGWARVHGEQWRVHSDWPLTRGSEVRVVGRRGLTLSVTPLADTQPIGSAQPADSAQLRQLAADTRSESPATPPPQQGEIR